MIDVLLPFHGAPELLRQTVRSIQSQTSSEWRLIIVNDAHPDRTVDSWAEDLAATDSRICYHRNVENLGANGNYMKALSLARADLIVFMGADDLMLPNYLQVMESAATLFPEAVVYECGVEVVGAEGGVVNPLVDRIKDLLRPNIAGTTRLTGEPLLSSLLNGNWTYFPSLCWRRKVVRNLGFRPEFHVVQDLALLVDVLRQPGGTMALATEVAFQYRRHRGSDSAVKTLGGARFAEEKAYFRTIAKELGESGYPRAARAAKLHITSRLHAAALIPAAAIARDVNASRDLARHALAM